VLTYCCGCPLPPGEFVPARCPVHRRRPDCGRWTGRQARRPVTDGRRRPGDRCRHCTVFKCCRPKGLCWGCYYTLAVRALYPPLSPAGRRGVGRGDRKCRPASDVTDSRPGSPERIAVYAGRAERDEEIFSKRDGWAAAS
jgi:hypothetical protein